METYWPCHWAKLESEKPEGPLLRFGSPASTTLSAFPNPPSVPKFPADWRDALANFSEIYGEIF